MSARERWFDRRFAFDLPNARFPSIVERLRGTPARLEERLRGVPLGLVTRRDGDRWSMQENAGHLGDLEPLWIARVEDLQAGRAELTAADLTNTKTHTANHNARPLDEVLRRFTPAGAGFFRAPHSSTMGESPLFRPDTLIVA